MTNAVARARGILAKLLIVSAGSASAAAAGSPQSVHCDVAIIGGGAGGLHTAYRLAPKLGSAVCVFEKEARLGGRILDVFIALVLLAGGSAGEARGGPADGIGSRPISLESVIRLGAPGVSMRRATLRPRRRAL